MRVADDAEGTLNSIQARTDDLTSQTDWSQPALLQQHMIVAEVSSSLIVHIAVLCVCNGLLPVMLIPIKYSKLLITATFS